MWVAQEAAIEATSEIESLGIELDHEVDIVTIIQKAGLPLLFRPLGNLSGAYIPARPETGSIAGILIHSGHPRSLQRYTAAHEYAHHLQDQELSLDSQTEVIGRRAQMALPPRERFAEVFAAWFLMPPQLVAGFVKALGIDLSRPDPPDIYQLSLALGTSYRATITHLVSLKMLTITHAGRLRGWQPREIKKKLGWNRGTSNPRNDVWVVNKKYSGRTIHPRVGDELYVILPETPSTGYLWVGTDTDPGVVLAGQRFVEPEIDFLGGEGERQFKFGMAHAGMVDLALSMQRPWIGAMSIIDTFGIKLSIQGERLGISPDFLLAHTS